MPSGLDPDEMSDVSMRTYCASVKLDILRCGTWHLDEIFRRHGFGIYGLFYGDVPARCEKLRTEIRLSSGGPLGPVKSALVRVLYSEFYDNFSFTRAAGPERIDTHRCSPPVSGLPTDVPYRIYRVLLTAV